MATGATDTFVYVDAMVEIDVLGNAINSVPFQRDMFCVAFPNGF
jgi:hypothetical protein